MLRPMTEADLDAVYGIECQSFARAWNYEAFEYALRDGTAHYFVYTEGDAVVAYSGMRLILDEVHIANIAVSPVHRRKGIGKALVRNIIEFADARAVRGITLEVSVNNIAAKKLYSDFGFVTEGVRKKYYEDGSDALIMWRYDR